MTLSGEVNVAESPQRWQVNCFVSVAGWRNACEIIFFYQIIVLRP